MSRREDAARLVAAMQREAARLDDLVAVMRDNRMAYVALRPSVMQAGIAAMERIATDCRALATARIELQQRLGHGAIDEQPADLRRDLRRVGERLQLAAAAVRVENGVGVRLLEFSRNAQENLMLSLYTRAPMHGYDRSARAVQSVTRGTLVTGTV